LMETVSTTGGLGNLANWQQHILPNLLIRPGRKMEEILGEPLPPEATPRKDYRGSSRLIVPTVRNTLAAGENLSLKVIVAGADAEEVRIFWKPMGSGAFQSFSAVHLARSVYRGEFPAAALTGDFEYYVQVETGEAELLYFPPTAPDLNQTVVVF